MARVRGKFWLNENGSERTPDFQSKIGGLSIKYYREAAVIQFAEWKASPEYTGYGKAFTLHLDRLTEDQLNELDVVLSVPARMELEERSVAMKK